MLYLKNKVYRNRFEPGLTPRARAQSQVWYLSWQGLFFSLATVGLGTVLFVSAHIAAYNVNMIYILLTLAATVWFGLGAGLLTATVALLCFDFFFIVPYYSFLGQVQDALAIFMFFFTALFTNQILGRAQVHSRQAQARAKEVSALYELVTTAITDLENSEFLPNVLGKVTQALDIEQGVLFLSATGSAQTLEEAARMPRVYRPESKENSGLLVVDQTALEAVFESNQAFFAQETAGPEAASASPSRSIAYLPLSAARGPLGVLVVSAKAGPGQIGFNQAEQRVLEIFANHLTLVIEHVRLVQENVQVAALRESDRLKSALLASVSHELRTPLTAIRTATNSLLNPRSKLVEEARIQFLKMIEQEVSRLTRLVSNLLDLSRLEGGTFKPDWGWYYVPEIVERVIERLEGGGLTQSHRIETYFAPDVPLARLDYLQIDQVLTNLLENALKYSPSDTLITIGVKTATISDNDRQLRVSVSDEGIGIASAEQALVFDKFYRGSNLSVVGKPAPGTGIGLTIAKGIVEAHGGRIWVEAGRATKGSTFYFSLPLFEPIPQNPVEE